MHNAASRILYALEAVNASGIFSMHTRAAFLFYRSFQRFRMPANQYTREPYPDHPCRTPSDLAQRLLDNGMTGVNRETLTMRIEQVGYFRLKGYWYPFLTPDRENPDKKRLPFTTPTSFTTIWDRYLFDQELRLVAFDGIITIENFLKNFMAMELSQFAGPFGYMTNEGLPGLSPQEHGACLQTFLSSYSKSRLTYIEHFRHKYREPLPPYWMIVGCLSYGAFKETMFKGAPDSIRRKLATRLRIINRNSNPGFSGDVKILSNWLETIRQVRNITAHHDRLWNVRNIKIMPQLPRLDREHPDWWGNAWEPFHHTQGTASFFTMENHLLAAIGSRRWRDRFISLMGVHPEIPQEDMGFPDGWRSLPVWQ